jgi:hypothetical protein
VTILGEDFNALAIFGEGYNAQTISCASNHQIRGESTLLFFYPVQTPVLCENTSAVELEMGSRLSEVWA